MPRARSLAARALAGAFVLGAALTLPAAPVRAVVLVAQPARALPSGALAPRTLTPEAAVRFAELALACVHREYPGRIGHSLRSDADVRPARELTPAFYGCYDWHSAVHAHWLLARVARLYPDSPVAARARAALAESLTPERIAGELAYFRQPGRASFERPYGYAWLLQLGLELRRWDDPDARAWRAALEPLEQEMAARLTSYLPQLTYPIRNGEHTQTAFGLALARDWAVATGQAELRALIDARARAFYLNDRACPLAYEPSGEDFVSPCLAEADLMRRVLPRKDYARWLGRFLPTIQRRDGKPWLAPALVSDRTDPKLAHIDGLNLSRAWMLQGIAAGLPDDDRRRQTLLLTSAAHADAALPAVTGEHYVGGHWLGTFAVFLTTRADLSD